MQFIHAIKVTMLLIYLWVGNGVDEKFIGMMNKCKKIGIHKSNQWFE